MLKRLFILGAIVLLPALAAASATLDRADKALDHGELAKARFLYGQALDADPCDSAAQSGLVKAQGDPAPYKQRCSGDDAQPQAAAVKVEPAAAEPTAVPNEAAIEMPQGDHRPASLKGGAQPGEDVKLGVGSVAPTADEAAEEDALGANDVGSQAKGHRHGGGPHRSQLEKEHPLLAAATSPTLWLSLLGLGVAAAAVALGIVTVTKRRRALAAAPAPVEGAPDAVEALVEAAPAVTPLPTPPAPVAVAAAAAAPQALPPQALPPEAAAAEAAPWTSPLTPGEAVIARLDGPRTQAGLTVHQFYFSGPRGVKEGWFRREERLTLAVPLNQVTGLGWAERGGERLIVGTALAGDIALKASDFGALALRQFAHELSKALDRPLA